MPVFNPVSVKVFVAYLFDAFTFPSHTSGNSIAEVGMDITAAVVGGASQVTKSGLFGAFRQVHGLNAGLDVEPYDEGGRTLGTLQFPKWGKHESIQLKRGVTFAPELWDWNYQVVNGTLPPIRKNGVIILGDHGNRAVQDSPLPFNLPIVDFLPVAAWMFLGGLPTKLELADLDAQETDAAVAIETLTIAHEGLFRVSLAQIPFAGDLITRLV